MVQVGHNIEKSKRGRPCLYCPVISALLVFNLLVLFNVYGFSC